MFTPRYWVDLVRAAESAGIDMAVIPDSFVLQPGGEPAHRGRLDAVAIAARVAPVTTSIGLVPVASVTHTEPFHISRAIATLDYASHGRAGWQVEVADLDAEFELFGRKQVQSRDSLRAEAAEYCELVTRLWDSWEDDAVIRDSATGRFLDRTKVHYVDFQGEYLSVRGPSITPRPPQGRPVVLVREEVRTPGLRADIVRVSAPCLDAVADVARRVRGAHSLVLLDVEVLVAETTAQAKEELDQLCEWMGEDYRPSSVLQVGSADELAGFLGGLGELGYVDGVMLQPLALPSSLRALPRRRHGRGGTLRARLGLPRPANVFAASPKGE